MMFYDNYHFHGTVESGELSTGNALAGRAESAIGSAARRPFSKK